MRKIKFALLSEQFVARDGQHRFSLHGVNPTLARTSFFCRRLSLSFAPLTPLPPDGFVLVRWEGGLYGDLCATGRRFSSWPAAGCFGRATRSFSSLIGNFHRPVSLEDVNPLSLSLSISSSCLYRSVHFMNWSCQV